VDEIDTKIQKEARFRFASIFFSILLVSGVQKRDFDSENRKMILELNDSQRDDF
jgi:hypothetical protein